MNNMLSKLSDNASVWIFQANQQLSHAQINHVKKALTIFVPEWAAHGVSLKADFEIVKDLFVMIGVDESYTEASGCSKDTLTRKIKTIGDEIGVDFLDRLQIAYVTKKGKIALTDLVSFKELVQKDIIRQDTLVYNNLITKKSELFADWEVKVSNSWHANLLPIL